jgi:hypothetical protein
MTYVIMAFSIMTPRTCYSIGTLTIKMLSIILIIVMHSELHKYCAQCRNLAFILSVIILMFLSFIMPLRYADCLKSKFHNAEYHYAKRRYAQCHIVCRYTECCCSE